VLSTLRYFKDEYISHIVEKKCPAGVCKALIQYTIDAGQCTGCGLCKRHCPQQAIEGENKKPHSIDQERCVTCGICYDLCTFGAVLKTDREEKDA
jgi:NADP-reducing hydrogenase subunit HndC